jgi:hypothetical protein
MPTLKYDWNSVDPVRRARIDDAETYAKRINEGVGFYDWLHIGEGLAEWRDAALELTGSQDMDTPAYRAAFAAAVPRYPQLAKIAKDKAERSYAIWMWENHEALEGWHAGLDDKQRRRWNHPRTVWNHSPLGKASREARAEQRTTAPRKRPAQAAEIEAATQRLNDTFDRVEHRLGPDLAGLFDLSPEHVDSSVDNFLAIFEKADVQRFVEKLLARLAPPQPTQPVDSVIAKSLKTPRRGIKKLDDPSRPRNRKTAATANLAKHLWS